MPSMKGWAINAPCLLIFRKDNFNDVTFCDFSDPSEPSSQTDINGKNDQRKKSLQSNQSTTNYVYCS